MWVCNICNKSLVRAGGHPRTHTLYVVWNTGLTKKVDSRLSGGAPRESLLGNANRRGKPMSEDAKRRISESMKIAHKESRAASWKGHIHTLETRQKISESAKGAVRSEDLKQQVSKALKELWKDPNHAKLIMHRREISGPEKQFQQIIDENGFPFKFVGHGDLIIEGKNPDFVHESKQKLIEIYGDFYHKGQNPQDRIDFFKELGWDCLVFWASEVQQRRNEVIDRVRNF